MNASEGFDGYSSHFTFTFTFPDCMSLQYVMPGLPPFSFNLMEPVSLVVLQTTNKDQIVSFKNFKAFGYVQSFAFPQISPMPFRFVFQIAQPKPTILLVLSYLSTDFTATELTFYNSTSASVLAVNLSMPIIRISFPSCSESFTIENITRHTTSTSEKEVIGVVLSLVKVELQYQGLLLFSKNFGDSSNCLIGLNSSLTLYLPNWMVSTQIEFKRHFTLPFSSEHCHQITKSYLSRSCFALIPHLYNDTDREHISLQTSVVDPLKRLVKDSPPSRFLKEILINIKRTHIIRKYQRSLGYEESNSTFTSLEVFKKSYEVQTFLKINSKL